MRRPQAVLYAAAAASVGAAVQIYDGEYRNEPGGKLAIALITIAIVAAAAAVTMRASQTARGTSFEDADTPSPPYSGGRAGVGSFSSVLSNRNTKSPPVSLPPEYRERGKAGIPPDGPTVILLAVLLAVQFAILLTHRPDSADHAFLLPDQVPSLSYYTAGLAAAAGLTALLAFAALRLLPVLITRLCFFVALVLFFFVSAAALAWTTRPHSDAAPRIDVFVFQQQGARALLHGRNPYAIDDYPDIYHSGATDPATGRKSQEVYGPGMSDGRTLRFGFPYLPMSLYLATAGYAAAGDYRFAQLAALVIAALLLYAARPGATSALAALLLLFTPRVFFVLISGWTEPLLVLWTAAAVYCGARRPRLLPVALGLLLATKQYMLLALPLTALLVPPQGRGGDVSPWRGWRGLLPQWRPWLRLLLTSGLVAAAVTLPLALWDWKRFYFSAFTVQQYAPFRWDALSYLTWRAFGHGPPSPRTTVILPAVASLAATALCLWRAPRTPAGFAGSVGLVLLVFFAFSKQAFANYYFFVIGSLCCAAASAAQINARTAEQVAPDV